MNTTDCMTITITTSRDNRLRCLVTNLPSTKILSIRRQNNIFSDPNATNVYMNNV